jgi:hypothetical protein
VLDAMKILRRTLLIASFLLAATSVKAAENKAKHEGFSELTLDQVEALIQKKDADIFDNNGEDVYQKGHVPTAKWVAFNNVKASDLPKDHSRKLVFYCANTH